MKIIYVQNVYFVRYIRIFLCLNFNSYLKLLFILLIRTYYSYKNQVVWLWSLLIPLRKVLNALRKCSKTTFCGFYVIPKIKVSNKINFSTLKDNTKKIKIMTKAILLLSDELTVYNLSYKTFCCILCIFSTVWVKIRETSDSNNCSTYLHQS